MQESGKLWKSRRSLHTHEAGDKLPNCSSHRKQWAGFQEAVWCHTLTLVHPAPICAGLSFSPAPPIIAATTPWFPQYFLPTLHMTTWTLLIVWLCHCAPALISCWMKSSGLFHDDWARLQSQKTLRAGQPNCRSKIFWLLWYLILSL